MINKSKQCGIAHYNNKKLHIINDYEIHADGESILHELAGRYQSQPGFMFGCKVLSRTFEGVNYCWWLFTDKVAINYQHEDGERLLHCWAAPTEALRIRGLVTTCNPFAQWELR